ncbi:MAG: D-alanyl-D-alanine carboxypeptidase family protein [Hyphomicrobiaceae bacterium]
MPFRHLVIVIVALFVTTLPAKAGPALVFEVGSGEVIYSEDADTAWHPASLTKLMTAYLTFQALKDGRLKLDDKLVCSEAANKTSPSKVGLPVGAEMTVDLGIRALIVKSANDVAVMLAERIGGSEAGFATMMNETARKLGMTRSHFNNPHGLPDPGQITSARDMALLTRAIIRDFPEYAELFTMESVMIGKRRLASHNGLLKTFEGADGMKTGFICDSGYNIVASATREEHRLVAVVLGEASSSTRNLRAMMLLQHGFESREWKEYFGSATLDNLPVEPGATTTPVSIRTQVKAAACGYRGASTGKKSTKKKKKKKK